MSVKFADGKLRLIPSRQQIVHQHGRILKHLKQIVVYILQNLK